MSLICKALRQYKKMGAPAKASIWFVFCNFFQKGILFITVPIFARILSPEDYGLTNLFSTWSTLLIIFATLNLSGGVYSRGLLEFEEKRFTSAIQGLATTSTFVVSIIIFALHEPLSEISGLPTQILYLMCIYFFTIAGINLWTVKQRFFYKYKKLIIITIINVLLSTTLGLIAAIVSANKGEAKIIWTTTGMILVATPFYIYNFLKGKTFYNKKIWRYALSFNLPLLPHYLSNLILSQSDRIMINWFCGKADVAFYSIAYSVSSIISTFTEAVNQTLTPWRYQNMKKGNYSRINKVSLKILLLVSILIITTNLFAPELLYIFGGKTYMEAVYVVPPVIVSVFFIFLYNMFSGIEFYFLKTRFMMIASLFSAVFNLILNYIFIEKYGYIACAYTTLICYIIYTLSHYVYMRHICKKMIKKTTIYDIRKITAITLLTCLLAAISTLLYNNYTLRYLLILATVVIAIINKDKIRKLMRLK